MTTFQIPEGKIVDRIEFEAGEGKATLNIIYKEEKPKEKKRVVVVCETKEPTCIHLSKLTGELVVCGRADKPDPSYYVPMKKAESGEFIVFSLDAYKEVKWELLEIEDLLTTVAKGNVTTEVAFGLVAQTTLSLRGLRHFLEAQGK